MAQADTKSAATSFFFIITLLFLVLGNPSPPRGRPIESPIGRENDCREACVTLGYGDAFDPNAAWRTDERSFQMLPCSGNIKSRASHPVIERDRGKSRPGLRNMA